MAQNPDVTKLADYAGTFQKRLITQLMYGLRVVADCTLRPNIKVKQNMTKMTVDGDVRPYTGERPDNKKAKIAYEPRSIEVHIGQYDLDIDTVKARETWLGEVMKPGVDPKDIPFESLTWQKVMDDYGTKINTNTVFNGVRNSAGTTSADLADGFGTIIKKEITAGELVPVVTGSMLTDTVSKAEAVYKSLPEIQRERDMVMYCSVSVSDAYKEDYFDRFGLSPIYDKFNQLVIRHSDGKCVLKPVSWMAGSQRVICTPQSNMIVGTDLLSDGNKILTNPQLYKLEAGILMAIGFQIEDLEIVAVNDQL